MVIQESIDARDRQIYKAKSRRSNLRHAINWFTSKVGSTVHNTHRQLSKMNDSMEAENSISPIRSRPQAPPAMEGVEGATSSPNPQLDQDHGSNNSWYEYPDVSGVQADTSGIETQAQGETTAEMNDKEEGDAKSETSSVMFDYDVDPEGFARRLDELAGTLEVGEEEARALRWGPAMVKEGNSASLQN